MSKISKNEEHAMPLVSGGVLKVEDTGIVFRWKGGRWKRNDYQRRSGYWVVTFRAMGRMLYVRVHRLVWRVFRGEIPDGLTINHKDGNKSNNALENLELATESEQMLHAYSTSLMSKAGIKHHRALFTEEQIRDIRERLAGGERCCDLSREFGCSKGAIFNIKRRRTWNHVP